MKATGRLFAAAATLRVATLAPAGARTLTEYAIPGRKRALRYTGLGLALLLQCLTLPSRALGCVVGTGTGASCTESALTACLPGGGGFDGTATFNCGGAATITVTSTKTISADAAIDGGSLITISGGHSVGVFSVSTGVNFTVQNLTIADGNNAVYGGGIYNRGTLTVTNSTFSNNTTSGIGGGGGGIYNAGGTLTVTNCTFSGNRAPGGTGGGILSTSGTLAVTNSSFSGNSAAAGDGNSSPGGGGGAIETLSGAITNSTFSGNRAAWGGAIASYGTVMVTNDTFFGNTATWGNGTGGGISNGPGDSSTLTVANSTFSGNSGGALSNSSGTVIVTNTILANSSSGGNCAGTLITDGGHNIDDQGSCGFSATSLSNTNPLLDPAGLANNGGPTQTIALQAGSPAINAGDQGVCAALPVDNLDQRGYVRPGAGAASCSIGAYEYNAAAPPPISPTATRTNTPTGSPTDTPPSTATPTATATQVPPTVTRTKTATAIAAPACLGDCDGSGKVTVNELITLVNVALGNAQSSACRYGVPSGDKVDISLIVHSVNNALSCGCNVVCPTPLPTRPPTQTATPTRTPTSAPTPTPTPRPPTATPTLPAVGKVLFEEGWEKSTAQQYGPLSVIRGDTGAWLNGIGDVSDACRATTANSAQVIVQGGSHRLQLHSARDPDCSDDSEFVEPIVLTNPVGPRDLNIAVDENVYLSFEETGALVNPDPCDAVTVSVAFDHGNPLTYVLQHGSAWDTDPGSCGGIFAENTILLPADQGSFVRNLSDDAATVDVFPADNVNAIEFGVRSHGDATFDNITFFSAAGAPPAPTATPTPKPSGGGGGCLRVSGGNSTVKVVNSNHSMIDAYFGSSVGFSFDLAPGQCFLVGIQLDDGDTLDTEVEITQCTPAAEGGCGDDFGPTEYVPLGLQQGQTVTITVGSNFFN